MNVEKPTVRERIGLGIAFAGFVSLVVWEFMPFEMEWTTWWAIWAAFGAMAVGGVVIAFRPHNVDAALKRRYEVNSAIVSPREPKNDA